MRLLNVLPLIVLVVASKAAPAETAPQKPKKWGNSNTNSDKKNSETPVNEVDESPNQHDEAIVNTKTPDVTDNTNSSLLTNSSTPVEHCSVLSTSLGTLIGLQQDCTVHDNCLGANCIVTIMDHKMVYNFSVKPCDKPSVKLEFNITDIAGANISAEYTVSDHVTIPHGNLSYRGMYETESNVDIVLDHTLQGLTHFRLDFGVHYRVLQSDPLKSLFTHTLVPTIALEFSEEMCVQPTGDAANNETYFGVIPKEYVEDKTKLALIGTSIALGIVVLIGLIYFIVAKRRKEGNFYRTFVSTDENRHLTKGNDGFEPLDDSDID